MKSTYAFTTTLPDWVIWLLEETSKERNIHKNKVIIERAKAFKKRKLEKEIKKWLEDRYEESAELMSFFEEAQFTSMSETDE